MSTSIHQTDRRDGNRYHITPAGAGSACYFFPYAHVSVRVRKVATTSPPDGGDVVRSSPGADGHNYAKYGIGQSLVVVPGYVVSRTVLPHLLSLPVFIDAYGNQRMGTVIYGTALINALIGAACVSLTYLLALLTGVTRQTAFALAAHRAVGTVATRMEAP